MILEIGGIFFFSILVVLLILGVLHLIDKVFENERHIEFEKSDRICDRNMMYDRIKAIEKRLPQIKKEKTK